MKKKLGFRIKVFGVLVFIINKFLLVFIIRFDKVWEKSSVTRLCRFDERVY